MSEYLNILLYIQIGLCAVCLYRIIRGPTIPDRMVGIDIFGILVVGICALISIQTERSYILDIGIAWIILSFIATLTLAKYLTGKKLNE
jgi:multicomponent Na+:H+ antiporter subunit F